jgi:RNA polymerase sigma factor (TIGR02999 family)
MDATTATRLTTLLQRMCDGDGEAADEAAPLVYSQLHRIAEGFMRRERSDHTLQATALVNQAFMELAGIADVSWQNRKAYYATAAMHMRRALVDHARARSRQKRGGDWDRTPFTILLDSLDGSPLDAASFLDLHESLKVLERIDARGAKVVELRFFVGLTIAEVAELLEVSDATVENDFRAARAWLRDRLSR